MSLADMFKTTKTTIKTTINGKEVTDDQQKQFDELWSSFDATMKSFGAMKDGIFSQTDEVELYGVSKEDAINKANKYSVNGFKMTSLKEDENLKVWKVTMKKEG